LFLQGPSIVDVQHCVLAIQSERTVPTLELWQELYNSSLFVPVIEISKMHQSF